MDTWNSNDVRFGMLLMERRVDEVHFVTEYLVVAWADDAGRVVERNHGD